MSWRTISWQIFILLLLAAGRQLAQLGNDAGHQAVREMQAGDYQTARQVLEAALKQSPRDARLWTLHGLALVRLGNENQGLSSFERALQIAPDYYPALEGAVQVELQIGSPHAVATLRRMQTLHPDDISVLRELAFSLMKQKDVADALPIFQRVAALQPSDEKVQLDLAVVQFLTGHYVDVISTLVPVASNPSPDAEVLDLLAQAYSFTSQTEKALAVLQSAIAANPANGQFYLDYANICLAHGCFQSGIDVVTSGLKWIPNSARLYVARGVLYSELADYEKGESDFRHAEEIDPNVEGGTFSKGLAELQRNDLAEAEDTVRARLASKPGDPLLEYLLAEVLTRKGAAPGTREFQQALSAARESVNLKPDFAPARDLLARLYVEEGNLQEGIRQSKQALRLNPLDQKALYHLIVALRKAGQTEQVPALLKQLVQLREQAGRQAATNHNFANLEQTNGTGVPASHP